MMTTKDSEDSYAAIADLYDYVAPYSTRPDVNFFVEEARRFGGPVLEVGCGTGRVLIPTARAGIAVTGVDRSRSMLDICRTQLRQEKEEVRSRVTLVEGDMRELDFTGTVPLATLPFRPFQHLLNVEDQMRTLCAIRNHLAPGGSLILDVFNPSLHALVNDPLGEEFGNEPEFTTPDGRRVVRRQVLRARDHARQILDIDLVYHITFADGHTDTVTQSVALRYFFRYEVEHLLARAGYVVKNIYGDYDRTPFGGRAPAEIIVIAERGS